MNEVKPPKKPLLYYYGIALLLLLLFSIFVADFTLYRMIRDSIKIERLEKTRFRIPSPAWATARAF